MDYKEKVIALLNRQKLSKEQKEKLESIFPELKEESEDEKIRKWIISYLDNKALNSGILQEKENIKKAIAWLEKQSKASKVEQAMREVEEKAKAFTEAHKGETSEEILAQMRGEQNPAWSEDDEMFVHGLIRGLAAKRDIHGHTTFSSDCIDITKTINWLKFLRPQNTWKPSEVQMEILQYLCENSSHPNENVIPTLESLYQDLKKLKG